MSKTYHVKTPKELKDTYAAIAKGINKPFKSTRKMFVMMGVQIDRDTMLTFKKEGAYLDRPKWLSYNWGQGVSYKGTKRFPSSTRNRGGTYKKRLGTDGSKIRRYSPKSKLLQASGSFKQTFRIIKIGKEKMLYGTKHKLANEIMSNPERQAIHYTVKDRKRYSQKIRKWWNGEIKF